MAFIKSSKFVIPKRWAPGSDAASEGLAGLSLRMWLVHIKMCYKVRYPGLWRLSTKIIYSTSLCFQYIGLNNIDYENEFHLFTFAFLMWQLEIFKLHLRLVFLLGRCCSKSFNSIWLPTHFFYFFILSVVFKIIGTRWPRGPFCFLRARKHLFFAWLPSATLAWSESEETVSDSTGDSELPPQKETEAPTGAALAQGSGGLSLNHDHLCNNLAL